MEIKLINDRSQFGKRLLKTIMKTFIFLMCTSVFCLTTDNTFSQEKIMIEKDQLVTVDQVFKIIKKQTEFDFVYPRRVFKNKPKVKLKKGEVTVEELLGISLAGSNFNFELTEQKTVLIKEKPVSLVVEVQQHQVTGTVKDEYGNELPGASILEEGSTNGTTTDIDGKFAIDVSDSNAVLIISYVGYASKKVSVEGKSTLNITLKEDATALDQIVLTGYQKQTSDAIKLKRATVQIAEFLSQDNIGRLPDFAAADAARRMAGVNVVFEEDEATKIAIRGLDPIYTNSSIDGLFIPGAEKRSRVANFEIIPSSAISTLAVYKSRTADLNGNAIAGNFDMKTRSAYDSKEPYLAGRFTLGSYSFQEIPRSPNDRKKVDKNGPSIRTDLTYASQFGKNDQFGIVLSGSYNKKDRDQFKFPKNAYSLLNGDPEKPVPSRSYGSLYDNVVDRFGGLGKLEFKPSDDIYMSVSTNFYRKTDDEIRYENRIRSFVFDEASVSTTGGDFTQAEMRLSYDNFNVTRQLKSVGFDSYFNLGEAGKLALKGNMAQAKFLEDAIWGEFRTGSTTDLSGSYTVGPESFTMTLDNPAFFSNAANYLGTGRPGGRRYQDIEDSKIMDLSYSWNLDRAYKGNWGFKTGIQLKNLEHDFSRADMKVDYTGTDISWSDFPLKSYNHGFFTNAGMLTFDTDAFEAHIAQNSSTAAYDNDAFGYIYNRALVARPDDQFLINETINAYYAMARYKSDDLKMNFGLRYEQTKTDISRPLRENGSFNGNLLEQENNYNNLLPSVSLTYDFTDQIRLKTAYYKAIGRGDYTQISPGAIVDDINFTIRQGNPDLKPRKADNFDIFIETYFDNRSTILSFGAFRKNIKDEIANVVSINNDGYEVTTTTNVGTVDITGLGFSFNKGNFKGLLPGFLGNLGTSANYTYITGNREVNGLLLGELSAAPQNMANVQVFYQTKKFDARLAWNRVSGQVLSLSDTNASDNINTNRYWLPFSQFDFTANYFFTDKFSFFIEARNFTNASRGFNNLDYLMESSEFGSSIWAGITFNL